jgi:hypothetical protein
MSVQGPARAVQGSLCTSLGRRNVTRFKPGCSTLLEEGLIDNMKPNTDYIRHAAKLARKLQLDAAMGGKPEPDAEFFKALSKALDEIAAGLEVVSARE